MTVAERRLLAREIAMHFVGLPYRWGGDNPMTGFDCSGLAIEVYKSVGVLPRNGDWTAAGLLNLFAAHQVPGGVLMGLVFWGDPPTHVELTLNGLVSVGASGGMSSTVNDAAAIAADAYIKVRPFASRIGISAFVDPFQSIGG